ncbi:MAG: hypothetical protein CSA42_06560 [Gammaproteobacteria bacterium]|nr:MAG: hypothetical protein CSA42_06560 [Gammaproteobacteria bacterium]
MKTSKFALAIVTTVASASALAHPGHDHASSTAMLSHVLFYGSVVVGLAIIGVAAYKTFKKNAK